MPENTMPQSPISPVSSSSVSTPSTPSSPAPIILKIGGAIADSEPQIKNIARNLLVWQQNGTNLLLIHGGGNAISRLQKNFHIQPRFQNGIRITDRDEMPLVDMALCGAVNKSLVRLFRSEGLNAWGISGCDAGIIQAVRPTGINPDQHTGIPETVDIRPIQTLWKSGYLPILAPPSTDAHGLAMNINADEAALALAKTLGAKALIFISDVEGVLKNGQTVPLLNPNAARQMMGNGQIQGGMIPKIHSCLQALEAGVDSVHIGTCTLSENLDDLLSARRGTVIRKDMEIKNIEINQMKTQQNQAWEENLPFPAQYGKRLMVITRGEDCYLYDRSGRKYLDMASGIAVNSLGYGLKDLATTAQVQMERLIHISNLFATEPQLKLARKILESAQPLGDFRSLHFGNSGAEANEAAIKYARLYTRKKKGPEHSQLIAFSNGFHGRTLGSLSLTANENYRKSFAPLIPDVRFLPFNDIQAAEKALGHRTAAVIVEPLQGEGGLNSLTQDFALRLNSLCRLHDIVLIADEVQTGLGRCGELFASTCVGLQPDIITLAKPLAAGLPLSATLLKTHVHNAVEAGDHGSTFGGGPVTTSVALKVWEILSHPARLEENRRKGALLEKLLDNVLKRLGLPGEVRGMGMIRGLMIDLPQCDPDWCRALIEAVREEGVLVLRSGRNVIRFTPPLLMEDELLEEGVERFCSILKRFASS